MSKTIVGLESVIACFFVTAFAKANSIINVIDKLWEVTHLLDVMPLKAFGASAFYTSVLVPYKNKFSPFPILSTLFSEFRLWILIPKNLSFGFTYLKTYIQRPFRAYLAFAVTFSASLFLFCLTRKLFPAINTDVIDSAPLPVIVMPPAFILFFSGVRKLFSKNIGLPKFFYPIRQFIRIFFGFSLPRLSSSTATFITYFSFCRRTFLASPSPVFYGILSFVVRLFTGFACNRYIGRFTHEKIISHHNRYSHRYMGIII